jgi:hypothetical protein
MAASSSFPLNSLFWCAGCWGNMYPLTGNSGLTGSPVRQTSLLASRILARLARNPVPPAIEYDTSGEDSKCEGQYRPILKKSQYKFSTLFPISETEGKCCHSLGSSTLLWGDHRNIPGTGEFQIYLMWRKRNCCLKLWSLKSPERGQGKLQSKPILIIVAKAVYFFFVLNGVNQSFNENAELKSRIPRYEVSSIYADSLDDILKSGKAFGKGTVQFHSPGH